MRRPATLSGFAQLARRLNPDPALHQTLAIAGEEVAQRARDELQTQGAEDALVGSLAVSVSATGVEIGSDHPAARAAEFGTLHQAPRPWLQPAFQAALGSVRARLRQALKDHLTRKQRTPP